MLTRDYAPDRASYTLPSYSRDTSRLIPAPTIDSSVDSLSLLSVLVDALPKGLIVLSVDRAIIYWNQNAKRLCQELSSTQRHWTTLPTIVAELCEQVVEAGATSEPVILECQTPAYRSFRLTACWLAASTDSMNAAFNSQTGTAFSSQTGTAFSSQTGTAFSSQTGTAFSSQTYILATLEDRDEVLQQDIRVEQKKFHLTNREAEIWLLLKREYSYQTIATTLHISLNTVKTHIRNIHAKRHPYQSVSA